MSDIFPEHNLGRYVTAYPMPLSCAPIQVGGEDNASISSGWRVAGDLMVPRGTMRGSFCVEEFGDG